MSLSHNHGEDKPPLILSQNKVNFSQPRNITEPSCISIGTSRHTSHKSDPVSGAIDAYISSSLRLPPGQTSYHESGHPDDINPTGTQRNVTTVRSASSGQHQLVVGKRDLATFQASHNIPVVSALDASPNRDSFETTKTGNIRDDDNHSYPDGGSAAWLVVLGSWSGMVASFGILNTVGTFQAYLSEHQLAQHSTGSIGWVFSIFAFLTFFCGVQIGPIFDAKGSRWLVAAGTVCLFAGLMGTAESTSMFQNSLLLPMILSDNIYHRTMAFRHLILHRLWYGLISDFHPRSWSDRPLV